MGADKLTNSRINLADRELILNRMRKLAEVIRMISNKYSWLRIVRLSGRSGHEADMSIGTAQNVLECLEAAIHLIETQRKSD
jgi:hypothetical protein